MELKSNRTILMMNEFYSIDSKTSADWIVFYICDRYQIFERENMAMKCIRCICININKLLSNYFNAYGKCVYMRYCWSICIPWIIRKHLIWNVSNRWFATNHCILFFFIFLRILLYRKPFSIYFLLNGKLWNVTIEPMKFHIENKVE